MYIYTPISVYIGEEINLLRRNNGIKSTVLPIVGCSHTKLMDKTLLVGNTFSFQKQLLAKHAQVSNSYTTTEEEATVFTNTGFLCGLMPG